MCEFFGAFGCPWRGGGVWFGLFDTCWSNELPALSVKGPALLPTFGHRSERRQAHGSRSLESCFMFFFFFPGGLSFDGLLWRFFGA